MELKLNPVFTKALQKDRLNLDWAGVGPEASILKVMAIKSAIGEESFKEPVKKAVPKAETPKKVEKKAETPKKTEVKATETKKVEAKAEKPKKVEATEKKTVKKETTEVKK